MFTHYYLNITGILLLIRLRPTIFRQISRPHYHNSGFFDFKVTRTEISNRLKTPARNSIKESASK